MRRQCAEQMVAVQIGLKRKHDRSSHEAVHCTASYFLTRRCASRYLAAWLTADSVQTGPVTPVVNVLLDVLSRWLSLRRLFSEDCANRLENEYWCGAAS